MARLQLLQGADVTHVHLVEVVYGNIVTLALGQGGRTRRRVAYAEVVDAARTYLPTLMLGRISGRGDMVVLDDHLRGQKIYLMAEITVLGIVDPEDAAHTYILEVAKTEIRNPEVLLQKRSEGYAVVIEHIEEGALGHSLVEDAVMVEVGVGVLFGVRFLLFHFRLYFSYVHALQSVVRRPHTAYAALNCL